VGENNNKGPRNKQKTKKNKAFLSKNTQMMIKNHKKPEGKPPKKQKNCEKTI